MLSFTVVYILILSVNSLNQTETAGPVFTKKSNRRIRLRIKLINSHYLLKISLNLLKFALLIKKVRIDILMLLKHGCLIKYLKY